MDMQTLAVVIGVVKSLPETAAQRAEAAATAAEEAASTVASATVEETKSYLGIE